MIRGYWICFLTFSSKIEFCSSGCLCSSCNCQRYLSLDVTYNNHNNNKKKGGKGDLELAPKMADKTKQKIRTILSIALDKNHDSIVLSGWLLIELMFNCKLLDVELMKIPQDSTILSFCLISSIAKLFHEIISKEYEGCFKYLLLFI